MSEQYRAWISANVPDFEHAYGKCAEVTETMVAAFPELKRVRGHYYCITWGERTHWWCVTPDGEIIDPTAKQFPSQGKGVYDPWIDGDPEPTGICANCGEPVFNHGTVCSEKCHIEYAAYCMNPY